MSPFSQVLDLFLPPRCISCQKIVSQVHTLCQNCWEEARFISPPFCACCGLPFEIDVPDGALCLDCARCHPPFEKARHVFPYDDFSRQLVLSLKHGDRSDLVPALSTWMVRAGSDFIKECDMVVPVPLHWRRLVKRRFNQAGLLSREVAKLTNLTFEPQLLKRTRHTAPQGHLSRMARQKNLKGAFDAHKGVAGKSVLLVDDVMTTGATILYCTEALLKSGAKKVYVVTLARVAHSKTQ